MRDEATAKTFQFKTERVGTRAALRCEGRLVGETADEFYAGVKPLLGEVTLLLLDLSKVTHMDSHGLGVLVRMFVSARRAGGELRVTHVGRQVRNLLKITHLLGVLGVK